jgi:hypothetical protein
MQRKLEKQTSGVDQSAAETPAAGPFPAID